MFRSAAKFETDTLHGDFFWNHDILLIIYLFIVSRSWKLPIDAIIVKKEPLDKYCWE